MGSRAAFKLWFESQISICGLLQIYLPPALSLSQLCLDPAIVDPDLQIDLLVWPWMCLVTTHLLGSHGTVSDSIFFHYLALVSRRVLDLFFQISVGCEGTAETGGCSQGCGWSTRPLHLWLAWTCVSLMSSAPCKNRVGPSLDCVQPWSPSLGLVLTLTGIAPWTWTCLNITDLPGDLLSDPDCHPQACPVVACATVCLATPLLCRLPIP